MQPIVAVIAPGMMGSAVGKRLVENGIEVRTSLAGRSEATVARAKAAGMVGVSDEQIAAADIILSILPPGDALGLAERLAPALRAAAKKPVFVDCNALDPGDRAAHRPRDPGDRGDLRRWRHRRRPAEGRIQRPQDLPVRRGGAARGRTDEVRAGDADPARSDRRGLGDEDVLCRHHQGLHRARRGDDAGGRARRHGGGPEGGTVRQPAGAVRLADAAGAEHVLQGVSLGRRDGGDRPVRRRGPAARQFYEGAARLYERIAADFEGDRKEIAALDAFCKPKS